MEMLSHPISGEIFLMKAVSVSGRRPSDERMRHRRAACRPGLNAHSYAAKNAMFFSPALNCGLASALMDPIVPYPYPIIHCSLVAMTLYSKDKSVSQQR